MSILAAKWWMLNSATDKPKPRRPVSIAHSPLPPFDADDPKYGQVHRVPPPELVIPAHFADPLFMRADFNGVTLEGDYMPTATADILAQGGVTITSGRWTGLRIPFLAGANSTPPTMIMTPMLVLYPWAVQDACLTEHAERGYDDFVIVSGGWNFAANEYNPSPADVVAWARYVQSWGFRVVYWGPGSIDDPFLMALVDAHGLNFVIAGEENDSHMTREQYDVVLRNTLGIVSGGIPIGAHFTENYPEGFPRDTFLTNWSDFDGKVHLMWQASVNDSAGKQAAMLYYARLRVNLGLIGGNGQEALNSRVIAYETSATSELYGLDETYGNLRSLELLYATRDDGRVAPVSGFGNGARYPDGGVI